MATGSCIGGVGIRCKRRRNAGEACAQVKKAGVIPEDHMRLCGVVDGAAWIWQHVQALFPQARQGLDEYHCAQDVHNIAKAQ
jgi:hypothetical protein